MLAHELPGRSTFALALVASIGLRGGGSVEVGWVGDANIQIIFLPIDIKLTNRYITIEAFDDEDRK